MTEYKVIKGQIRKLEKAEESTEHLARLHHGDADLQSSTGMGMLTEIAADSVLHFERVSRAVAGYRKTVQTEVKTDDPLTSYVQGMLAHAGKRSGNALPAPYRRKADGLRLLNVNDFIREAVQAVRRSVGKKVRLHAVPADEDVRVMADREKMSQVLATLVASGSEIIQEGGIITMLAKMLPIENALLERGGGCALLSVSSTDVDQSCSGAGRMTRKSVRRAFRAIRSVIRGHNGSVRVLRQEGKTAFNIYLPVLPETRDRYLSTPAPVDPAVAQEGYGREEAAWRQ
jgi:hypothetical protein